MPDSFYRTEIKKLNGTTLGPIGSFGCGIVFTPKADAGYKAIVEIFEAQVLSRGLKVIGWRKIETDNSALGNTAKSTEPRMAQVFIENSKNLPVDEFERELFRIRKTCESEAASHPDVAGNLYVCSLSSQTVTYKGQLTPEQVLGYFWDLQQESFVSHMALVHSRFSTNTFPSWERAQPVRMMCHNGEINTLRGNKNWMYSRGGTYTYKFIDIYCIQCLCIDCCISAICFFPDFVYKMVFSYFLP